MHVVIIRNIPQISRRLKKLMSSGDKVIGGDVDEEEKYIPPTVYANVSPSDPIMQEEVENTLNWAAIASYFIKHCIQMFQMTRWSENTVKYWH